jgi:hypothetical protein
MPGSCSSVAGSFGGSDGDAVALPLLEQAFEAALAAGQHFMAADAAHACALAGDMVAWTNCEADSPRPAAAGNNPPPMGVRRFREWEAMLSQPDHSL